MRRFVLGWKTLGHERRLRAYIVNYADDFVICCRGTAQQAMAAMRQMMRTLRLTVNEEKTRQGSVWDEAIDFLGGYVGRLYDAAAGVLRRAWVFVMALAYSRHLFARVVFDQRTATWLRLHAEAFTAFGGAVETVVSDYVPRHIIVEEDPWDAGETVEGHHVAAQEVRHGVAEKNCRKIWRESLSTITNPHSARCARPTWSLPK